MNRQQPAIDPQAALKSDFWSQPSSEQFHLLESLLQRLLNLPGFQQALESTSPAVNPSQPVVQSAPLNTGAQPSTNWAPSGSTWGPLAEVWKQVQRENESLTKPSMGWPEATADTSQAAHSLQKNEDQATNQQQQEISAWNTVQPVDALTPWKLSVSDAAQNSWQSLASQSSSPFPLSFAADTVEDASPPRRATEFKSSPVKPNALTRLLLTGNQITDSILCMLGWPGRAIQSGMGKWLVGLVGVGLFTAGSWLYFREALEEFAGFVLTMLV